MLGRLRLAGEKVLLSKVEALRMLQGAVPASSALRRATSPATALTEVEAKLGDR